MWDRHGVQAGLPGNEMSTTPDNLTWAADCRPRTWHLKAGPKNCFGGFGFYLC